MKEVILAASQRNSTGKGAARQSRMAGNIPGVIYGPELDPLPLELNEKDFRVAIKQASGFSSIIDLDINGKINKVIIRDLQRDPVTNEVIHIDFHAVSMNKPINLSIPVKIVGIPIGVKTEGGILETTMRELEISCLPTDIPEQFELDVSELAIGDSIHVEDLEIPKVKILAEPQRTVVVVAAPTVIKEAETTEEEAEAAEGEEAAEGTAAEEKKEGEPAQEESSKSEEKKK